jgi:membrane fusion protein, multidrug efflux system
MESISTQGLPPQTSAAAAPQPLPVGKPRRTAPTRAQSAYHGQWRRVILTAGAMVALAAIVVGVQYDIAARGHEATDAAVVDGHIIHVAPQVAGPVLQVLVTGNQPVHAGDLLVRIDPVDFTVKLDQSTAAAAAARGRLEQARWQLLVAEAARALAENEVVTARARGRSTAAKRTTVRLTVARLKADAAVAQVNLARAQIATAAAGVAAAEAALTRAALDLVDTEVRAPRSGRVMTTNIETGEYAQVGKDLLALVSDDLGARPTSRWTSLLPGLLRLAHVRA